MQKGLVAFFFLLTACISIALADVIKLKDGSRITGEIVSRTDTEVQIKTEFGSLTIPTAEILEIVTGDEEGEKQTEDVEALRRKAHQHLQNKEWQEAIDVYKKMLEQDPGDSNALYNSACAYSLLEKKQEAVEYLRKAVEAGFVDFAHIEQDSDLDNIREEEGYKKLFEEKEKLLAGAAEKTLERYKKQLGDEYRYQKDDDYKLIIITNVGQEQLDGLVNALRVYAESHWKDFFKFKPTYYITVLIPRDSQEYARRFGGMQGAAGFYNPGNKTLTVNLATGGGTMIHEFTHALHYADMEGLGQKHPIWIIEGFGSLYEQCTQREGSGFGLLNWRLPILKDAVAHDKCYPLKEFISGSESYFRRDASLSYAMARYIFYYLQEKKLLRKFYAKYRETYEEDKTGLKTLEEVCGKSVEQIEEEWLEFLKPLEYGRAPDPNRPFVGVGLEGVEGGVRITQVVGGSPAEEAGLKTGDVITKIAGSDVGTVEELQAEIGKHKIGDEVTFVVKRGDGEKEVKVKLGKRQ
jgi:tetratricopeptide (TPR) repeat protein